MTCSLSCSLSVVFLIGMIYFYNSTSYNKTVLEYKSKFPPKLQHLYEKIVNERRNISYRGYLLGFLLSILIIYYNLSLKKNKLNNTSLICIVISTSFITNYFYYILSPKSHWMLNHIKDPKLIKDWLQMYRIMQFNFHLGLVFGIIAIGLLTFAFRC
jgi:hypothetical protein